MPLCALRERLLEEKAQLDVARRHVRVMAERAAADKAGAAIKADRLRLVLAGFQPQHRFARCARFVLEPAQHRLGDTAAVSRRARKKRTCGSNSCAIARPWR